MEIRKTSDGSLTLFSPRFGETYHSVNGAITESEHVFIEAGLNKLQISPIQVLEIGFGTGLNAYLTYKELEKRQVPCKYTALELHKLDEKVYSEFAENESIREKGVFLKLHSCEWEQMVNISYLFQLQKINTDFLEFNYPANTFDVVYFDAFSPSVQPELWTFEVFEKMFCTLKNGGILTTYCAKGQIRRNMQQVGFSVERLPGPPGKREMLRALKNH